MYWEGVRACAPAILGGAGIRQGDADNEMAAEAGAGGEHGGRGEADGVGRLG